MNTDDDIRPLSLSSLTADPVVQRTMDQRRVERIKADFRIEAVGILTVSQRADGTNHIIDGNHRAHAMREVLGEHTKVMCRVFTGLSIEDEAVMFRLLNNTAKPQAIDIFRMRVIERDPMAVDIVSMLALNGWQVGRSPTQFIAVDVAQRLYRRDPAALRTTFTVLTRAWGHHKDTLNGRVTEGVGLVFARFGDAVIPDDMAGKLSRVTNGPIGVLNRGRVLRETLAVRIAAGIAEAVVEIYNKGRRSRALPPWRS